LHAAAFQLEYCNGIGFLENIEGFFIIKRNIANTPILAIRMKRFNPALCCCQDGKSG
jgi:hypothetical protein